MTAYIVFHVVVQVKIAIFSLLIHQKNYITDIFVLQTSTWLYTTEINLILHIILKIEVSKNIAKLCFIISKLNSINYTEFGFTCIKSNNHLIRFSKFLQLQDCKNFAWGKNVSINKSI